jgi:hypothetical protein
MDVVVAVTNGETLHYVRMKDNVVDMPELRQHGDSGRRETFT